jgi:RNA polymerase sigma-70 factor (ECF subfamily)
VVTDISESLQAQGIAQDDHAENASDESLMLDYQAGDLSAFDKLYQRYRQNLYRFMGRQLQGESDTLNELFQDVWLKLVRARDSYAEVSSFKTYLFQIANNTIRDHYRRAAVRKIVVAMDNESEIADDHASPEQRAAIQQQYRRLLDAIRGLPQEQREVFLLKEEAGLSITQIADVLTENPDTVKSRLRYAVRKLRDALTEQHKVFHAEVTGE